jgi:hypothetical protein
MQPIRLVSGRSIFAGLQKRSQSALAFLPAAFLALAANSLCAHAQPAENPNAADPVEIVWRMVAQNETRAQQLKYYSSRRHYHIEFHGLGRSMGADMHVQVTYNAGSGKTFHVIEESGSHLLLDHVLKRLLETEQDDARLQKAALTPFNYNFTFETQTNEDGRVLYVFSVEPKVKNKLLYRGKIWIDAEDFAVVKIEAQPAENPSFWIKNTEIHHSYAKIGEFWLPKTNISESSTRFGGAAVLTIDYGTYQFEEPHGAASAAADELSSRLVSPQ